MNNMKQFRICMIGAIILTCGFGVVVVLPIWIYGEFKNMKDPDAWKKADPKGNKANSKAS